MADAVTFMRYPSFRVPTWNGRCSREIMQDPPKTVEDAVNFLLSLLDKETMEIFARRSEEDLKFYHCTAGVLIRNEFNLVGGNQELLISCRNFENESDLDGKGASIVILRELWKSLRRVRH